MSDRFFSRAANEEDFIFRAPTSSNGGEAVTKLAAQKTVSGDKKLHIFPKILPVALLSAPSLFPDG